MIDEETNLAAIESNLKSLDEISDHLATDGAKGIAVINQINNKPGHVFNIENIDGHVWLFEAFDGVAVPLDQDAANVVDKIFPFELIQDYDLIISP